MYLGVASLQIEHQETLLTIPNQKLVPQLIVLFLHFIIEFELLHEGEVLGLLDGQVLGAELASVVFVVEPLQEFLALIVFDLNNIDPILLTIVIFDILPGHHVSEQVAVVRKLDDASVGLLEHVLVNLLYECVVHFDEAEHKIAMVLGVQLAVGDRLRSSILGQAVRERRCQIDSVLVVPFAVVVLIKVIFFLR